MALVVNGKVEWKHGPHTWQVVAKLVVALDGRARIGPQGGHESIGISFFVYLDDRET